MATLPLLLSLLVPASQQPLDTYIDKNRILLVFAPNLKDPQYLRQLHLLNQHPAELKERDLLIIPADSPARTRFHIAPTGFTVILIGKDGGEKLRSHQPLTLEKLKSTIDAMPMRQDEMRKPK